MPPHRRFCVGGDFLVFIKMKETYINKTSVIALMARDCADALKHNIPEIEKFAASFRESIIVCVENDSVDGTKDILSQWMKKNPNVITLSEDCHRFSDIRKGGSFARIERMAYYRNKYMTWINQSNFEPDYLIVMDVDIDCFHSEDVIKAIKNAPEPFAAIFANGRFYTKFFGKILWGKYYDTYTYVPEESNNWEITYTSAKQYNDQINKALRYKQFIKCKSAFSGMAIYQWSLVKDLRYAAEANNSSEFYPCLCEHVGFNRQIYKRGNLYISSELLVQYHKQNFARWLVSVMTNQTTAIKFVTKVLRVRLPN